MKKLLLLGGMTPDVTALYYKLINTHIRERLGKRHSAKLYIYSADLEEQLSRAQAHDWPAFATDFIDGIKPLVTGTSPAVQGVALSVILAHKVSAQIARSLSPEVPFLDITDFVAKELKGHSPPITKIGLIGPMITMADTSEDFFVGKLRAKHGIDVIVPESVEELQEVNRGMLEEVVRGREFVKDETRTMFKNAASALVERGAEALVLGSTDLGFVICQEDFDTQGVLVLDAAKVHAVGLANWMLDV